MFDFTRKKYHYKNSLIDQKIYKSETENDIIA